MKEIILAKYGEIILKGGNRPKFERMLIDNIKNALKNVADFKIWAVNNLFIPNTLGVVKSGKLSGTTCEIHVNSKHGRYVAEICY